MITKRVNKSKRAKLNSFGFKVYKNFRIYIAKSTEGGWCRSGKPAPRAEIVDMIREMWNNDPSIKAMRKHIKELSIVYQKTTKFAGLWNAEKQKISIIDAPNTSVDWFKGTFVHEIIGHVFWDFSRKWRREELIEFNKLANALPPVNTYVSDNEEKWREINDETEDFKQFQKSVEHIPEYDASEELTQEYDSKRKELEQRRKLNHHDVMTRYANEQHSAITEIVYDVARPKTLLNQKDVDRLVELWERLHY